MDSGLHQVSENILSSRVRQVTVRLQAITTVVYPLGREIRILLGLNGGGHAEARGPIRAKKPLEEAEKWNVSRGETRGVQERAHLLETKRQPSPRICVQHVECLSKRYRADNIEAVPRSHSCDVYYVVVGACFLFYDIDEVPAELVDVPKDLVSRRNGFV